MDGPLIREIPLYNHVAIDCFTCCYEYAILLQNTAKTKPKSAATGSTKETPANASIQRKDDASGSESKLKLKVGCDLL